MKAGFVCFHLLLLGFMFSATASRSFGLMKKEVALQEIHVQDKIDTAGYEESMVFEQSSPRKMDLEYTDYGGTGANDRHDPGSPGRA